DLTQCDFYRTMLQQDRDPESTYASSVEAATEAIVRAASFDTGAIEGLYATDRGMTLSVAHKEGRWEQQVDARGPTVRALFEAQLGVYRRLAGWDGQEPATEAFI